MKNKKLVLSVLATSVVASMATSAFAAEVKDGLYIGGSIKKFYSMDTIFDIEGAAKTAMYANINTQLAADATQLVYVGLDGKGASLDEILDEGATKAFAEPLKQSDFLESYDAIDENGNVTGQEKPVVDDVTPGELEVESVSAINAKTLQVTFGAEVDKVDAETAGNYVFTGLGAITATPTLGADKKTVTLALSAAVANDTSFAITVKEIKSATDATKKTPLFTQTLTFKDTVKPTYTSVTYPVAGSASLKFSEALSTEGTVKVYDGATEVTGLTIGLDATDKSVLNIDGITANKEYKVVILGAKDQSNNLLNPNPTEVLIKNVVTDTVKPAVTSVVSEDLHTVKVQFSEKLKATAPGVYATIKVDNVAVAGTTQTFDATTNTLTIYKATGVAAAGVHSVEISGHTDLANLAGDAFTKVMSFAGSAPVLQKTEVKTISNKQTLVLTFNEAPDATAAQAVDITGTYITPENVQKTIVTGDITEGTAVTVSGNELRIDVSTAAFGAGNYTLTIPKAGISDGATAAANDLTVTFTLGSTDSVKPVISNVYLPGTNASAAGGPNPVPRNEVYVKYDKAMDVSATNKDNYSVEGKKVFTNAIFVGDTKLVKLTLGEGQIALTGDQELAISNAVKGANNVAIDAYASTQAFVENVKPEVVSAALVDSTNVKVTFSEAVESTDLEVTAGTGNDFEVYVNGTKHAVTDVVSLAGAGVDGKEFKITFTGAITAEELATGTITLKVLATADAKDLATVANPVVVPATAVTVTK